MENRNHVWSDLSRLVDVECKNGLSFTKSILLPILFVEYMTTLWVSQFVHTTKGQFRYVLHKQGVEYSPSQYLP